MKKGFFILAPILSVLMGFSTPKLQATCGMQETVVKPIASADVPQSTCPVLGRPINQKYFADYEGKRVYFCCAACLSKFKENPAKYLEKLEQAGVRLQPVPEVK